jgi:hypothetical protein
VNTLEHPRIAEIGTVPWRRWLLETAIAALVLFAAALIITWPLVCNLTTSVLENGDTLQVSWLLAWETRQLLTNPSHLFSPGVMYPEPYALVYIEHMLGLLIPFAPLYLLTQNPTLAFNISLLIGYAMPGLGVYILLHALLPRGAAAWWAALVAGVLFVCSPWRLLQLCHLEQLSAFWLGPLVLCLIRYLRDERVLPGETGIGNPSTTPRWSWLIGFVLCTLAQTLISYYYVVTCALIIGVVMVAMLLARQTHFKAVLVAGLCVSATVLLIHLPLIQPYLAHPLPSLRPASEQHLFSLQVRQDLLGGRQSAWLRKLLWGTTEIEGYNGERAIDAGVMAYGLAGVAVVRGIIRRGRFYRWALAACLLVVALALILALGPYANVGGRQITMPFGWLRSLPGVASFRAPARLGQASIFALAIMAGLGLWWLMANHRLLAGGTGALLVLLIIGPTFNPTLRNLPAPQPTKAERWIAAELPHEAVLLHVPLDIRPYDGYSGVKEAAKMYASLFHQRRVVNSYLAEMPRGQKGKQLALAGFPSLGAMTCAAQMGITHILVNSQELTPTQQSRLASLPERQRLGLEEVYRDATQQVLAISPHSAAPPPPAELRFARYWYGVERVQDAWWCVSWGDGEVEIISPRAQVLRVTGRVNIVTAPDTLRLYQGDTLLSQADYAAGGHSTIGPIDIAVQAGVTTIRIVNQNKPTYVGQDPRLMAFAIGDVALNGVKLSPCFLR